MTDKEKRKKELQKYLSQNTMQINNAECWKCGKLMKMAMVLSNGEFFGPEKFNERQLELARSKEVIIKKQYSKTTKETYLANTCPICDSFMGKFFIHDYLDGTGERYKLD